MEYTTQELKVHHLKQADAINEMAKQGWELICVSFNIAYYKRDIDYGVIRPRLKPTPPSEINKDYYKLPNFNKTIKGKKR